MNKNEREEMTKHTRTIERRAEWRKFASIAS